MENFLFSNVEEPNRFRYFRLGKKWHECFVVEFMLGANHYEHLYWGNQDYVEEDRHVISSMLVMSVLPCSHDEWKIMDLDMEKKGFDFKPILSQAEDEIGKKINKQSLTV